MLANVILRAGVMLCGVLVACYFVVHGLNAMEHAALDPIVQVLQ